MARKLAMFFDGTWNNHKDETNVSRLFKLTKSSEHFRSRYSFFGNKFSNDNVKDDGDIEQIKYYHEGVGMKCGEILRGGAFGYGLSRIIKDGYIWLAEHYKQNDEIYIFGFSRGAYIARSLVGLIRKCGIPRCNYKILAQEAYHIYREKQWKPDGDEATVFRDTFSWPNVQIKFLGVWDTVGSLGIPVHGILFSSDYYRWHDTELSKIVKNAYHALALDEYRHCYTPTMWYKNKPVAEGQKVEQRWFPGAHADVGGGYKGGKLYQRPLQWMQQKAEECGLAFSEPVVVKSDAYLDTIHNSLKEFMYGIYAETEPLGFTPFNYRPLNFGVNEMIDDSVWKRVESQDGRDEIGGKYNPPELINYRRTQ